MKTARGSDPGTASPALAAAGLARWKCVCAYDGGNFPGWQSQPGGGAIQDVIEARLATIFGQAVRIHGSGRTDAGVHAWGQVFHFDALWRHGPTKLAVALGSGLPPTIQIRAMRQVPMAFHARFSVQEKVYRYELFLGAPDPFLRPFVWARQPNLDLPAMTAAANLLCGRHDFRAFAANNGVARVSTVRELRRLTVTRRGRRVRVEAAADGFLYKMVRSLVGALVAVGEGKLSLTDVRRLRDEAPARTNRVPTAPACGLFLFRVIYPRTMGRRLPAVSPAEDEALE